MNNQPYLKAKNLLMNALAAVVITVLVVYFAGIPFSRSITTNILISLSVITLMMFAFLVYGLYTGLRIQDDYSGPGNYKAGKILDGLNYFNAPASIDGGEGCTGIIVSILLWIAIGILSIILLLVFEAILWISLAILFGMLYWGFMRALRLVFRHVSQTRGNLPAAVTYAFYYTVLYIGWVIGIVYLVEVFR